MGCVRAPLRGRRPDNGGQQLLQLPLVVVDADLGAEPRARQPREEAGVDDEDQRTEHQEVELQEQDRAEEAALVDEGVGPGEGPVVQRRDLELRDALVEREPGHKAEGTLKALCGGGARRDAEGEDHPEDRVRDVKPVPDPLVALHEVLDEEAEGIAVRDERGASGKGQRVVGHPAVEHDPAHPGHHHHAVRERPRHHEERHVAQKICGPETQTRHARKQQHLLHSVDPQSHHLFAVKHGL